MNFAFTEEQDALRAAVRRFCDERSPTSEVRRLMDTTTGFDPDVWKQLSTGMGLSGLHVPEDLGGHGVGFVELTVVLEEMGRALLCAPFMSSACLAATALVDAAAPRDMVEPIAAGERRAALALAEPGGRWDLASLTLEATPTPDGFTLNGTKTFVIDGHTADVIVVVARAPGTTGPDGLGLYLVDGGARSLERTPLVTLDLTRKQADLAFEGTLAQAVGEPGTLERTLHHAAVCFAAESVGGAERCLEIGVAYAKERVQFGRPIGGFQAVKHMCADMLLRLESAKSAAYWAAFCAAAGHDDLPLAAGVAKAACTDAFFDNACTTHQILGGIGFTYEHDAHLYYRRAKTNQLYLGDPTYHREALADRLGV
jgi:alkylation response protein AidB-like acyl-CoA dehydrogenase